MICVIYQKVLKKRDGTIRNNCGMPAKWNDE